jgi:LacI family transcriptional regulator
MRGRRPTISDLAREAGVSRSTASRAMSGSGYVAASVRERIRASAERIGYVPDTVARSLRHRTSRAIGVLISDLRNPFYADVATAVEQRLRSVGYHIILANSDGLPEEELAAATLFTGSRVAGVIVAPVSPIASRFADAGIPVVEIDRQMIPGGCDAVLLENEAGADVATTHLLELGHRRIGLLLGEMSWATGPERLAGYRGALARAGVPFDDTLLVRGSGHPTEAEHLARQLLDRAPDVTAIFATNNLMAEDAIAEIQGRGLAIPDDISLVAFDDIPWMSIVQPRVTAVAQPTLDIGRTAADLLVARMTGVAPPEATVVRLHPDLVIRGSTAPPRPDRR